MTPSAPRSNALMMKSGLIRLLHGVRMIRTFGDILRRLVPARSAPVYVHQLQTNATTFGSKAAPAEETSVEEGIDMCTPGASRRAAGVSRRQRRARAPRRPVTDGTARLHPHSSNPCVSSRRATRRRCGSRCRTRQDVARWGGGGRTGTANEIDGGVQ